MQFTPTKFYKEDEPWSSGEYYFASDHPSTEGHFPGNPIVPGAALLDYALRTLSGKGSELPAVEVHVAKFFHAVRPGELLRFEWQEVGPGRFAVQGKFAKSDMVVFTAMLDIKLQV